MAFYGRTFIFDDIPSEEYGLMISSMDSGESTTSAPNNISLRTEKIFRRPVPFFYGVEQAEVLEIPVVVTTTETEITAEDATFIEKWLFGQMTYKELRVVQVDMEDIVFKCFLVDPKVLRFGNIIRGFEFKIKCDSPFAYGAEQTIDVLSASTYRTSTTPIAVSNRSDNNFYSYPNIYIRMTNFTPSVWPDGRGFFRITNLSDNNRVFSMGESNTTTSINLLPNEEITINNDLQIVESSASGYNRLLSLFSTTNNGRFFRLVPGTNLLTVVGNIRDFQITYTPFKRIS